MVPVHILPTQAWDLVGIGSTRSKLPKDCMNNTMLLKLLFALLLFCFHVSPQAAKADVTSEPLMEQTSFAAILDRTPKKLLHDIHIELWRKQIPLSDAEMHTLEVVLKEAFDPATLKTKFLSLSRARISNADSQAILDFYATPHGKKISEDEITANSGDLTDIRQIMSREEVVRMLSAERLIVADQLASKVLWSDLVKQLFKSSLEVKLSVSNALRPKSADSSNIDLMGESKGEAGKFASIPHSVIMSRLYSPVQLELLSQYASVANSPEFRSAAAVFSQIWVEIFSEATATLRTNVNKAFSSRKKILDPATQPETFGHRRDNPIEVCLPDGAQAYLDSLMCSEGEIPNINRLGNAGPRNRYPAEYEFYMGDKLIYNMLTSDPLVPGELDIHIIDAYSVKCGRSDSMIFVDRYHCSVKKETRVPKGLLIRQ